MMTEVESVNMFSPGLDEREMVMEERNLALFRPGLSGKNWRLC